MGRRCYTNEQCIWYFLEKVWHTKNDKLSILSFATSSCGWLNATKTGTHLSPWLTCCRAHQKQQGCTGPNVWMTNKIHHREVELGFLNPQSCELCILLTYFIAQITFEIKSKFSKCILLLATFVTAGTSLRRPSWFEVHSVKCLDHT